MPPFTRSASWYTALSCLVGSLSVLYLDPLWAAYWLMVAGCTALLVYVFRETA